MIGTRIANYQVIAEIGAGGMGTVYRALDSTTQQPVAIKRLKPELSTSEMLERFAREGEALRQLNHPNIVKVLATLQSDGSHFLVMEYLDGGALYDVLKATPQLPLSRVLSITLELADALARAHHLKIIHRDIKPANVLLASDGTPRLTDFGVAYLGNEKPITETGVAIGTLDYLSPEALNGEAVDARTDLWAFGVMLFEMLAGQRPFHSETVTGILTSILTQPTPDLEALRPDAPVALVDLIYRMLQKDKNQRIASARSVGAELEAIMQGRDTPSHPTRHIEPATPTPTDSAKPKHNLPTQTTPFVGREHEIAELTHLLEKSRLITILASGGMGKTRLAMEVGAQYIAPSAIPTFSHGVYFVALAPLTSSDFIVSTIAESVNFQFYQGGEPKQQLLDFLREKSMLLIMDNFEHVLDGANIVSDILQAAPSVKIIATSRERLNLSGETLFALSGMDFPEWETPTDALDYAAVKLFMQSALRIRPDFELTASDLTYIARICRLVDGLPLGIVLAAAWVEMLSLAEIADEISKSIDFLETEMRDIPERHRSIRAVFDYSWNLMTPDEQAVFMRLSVFRGGFTREAAQAVAVTSLKTLMSLVSKSLLRRDVTSGRYDIHELLRQYAESKLQQNLIEHDTTYDAHSAYFAGFLERRQYYFFDSRQRLAAIEIQTELDNIRYAWRRMVQRQKVDEISKSITSLAFTLTDWTNNFQEAFDLLEMAFQSIQSEAFQLRWLKGAILSTQAGVDFYMRNYDQAQQHIRDAEVLLADCDNLEYRIMFNIGLVAVYLGRSEPLVVRKSAENLLPTYAKIYGLFGLMFASLFEGDIQQAHKHLLEGLKVSEAQGNTLYTAQFNIHGGGNIYRYLGDFEQAILSVKKGVQFFESIKNMWGVSAGYHQLGSIAFQQQAYDHSQNYHRQELKVVNEMGNIHDSLIALHSLAAGLAAGGEGGKAVELLALILHHPTYSNAWSRDESETLRTKLQAELSPDDYAAAWERGNSLDLNTIVAELLAES